MNILPKADGKVFWKNTLPVGVNPAKLQLKGVAILNHIFILQQIRQIFLMKNLG